MFIYVIIETIYYDNGCSDAYDKAICAFISQNEAENYINIENKDGLRRLLRIEKILLEDYPGKES